MLIGHFLGRFRVLTTYKVTHPPHLGIRELPSGHGVYGGGTTRNRNLVDRIRALECTERREPCFQRLGSGKQNVVFLVEVVVQVLLKSLQRIEHRAVRVAGSLRRLKVGGQLANLLHRIAGHFVTVFHHADRVRDRPKGELRAIGCVDELPDGREKDLLFQTHVRLLLVTQFAEDRLHDSQTRKTMPVRVHGRFDQAAQPRKLVPEVRVMRYFDMIAQIRQVGAGPILRRRARGGGDALLQTSRDGIGLHMPKFADFRKRNAVANREIDPQRRKDLSRFRKSGDPSGDG